MNFEAGKYSENEKKLKKDFEKNNKEEILKKNKHNEIKKEYLKTEIETENNLFELKDLVDNGLITNEQAEHIIQNEELDNNDIKEIFEKIEEIEALKDIDTYLPTELRITSQEYNTAMVDDIFRIKTLTKIKTALTILGSQTGITNQAGVNLFSGFLSVLDKNLVLIQEHNIDMKNNLEKIENKKNPIKKGSLWQEIIKFLKEVFSSK